MSTLLVIDDSRGQLVGVRGALEDAALFDQVLEADDGIQGLRQLLSGAPDLVICDLEMPGLDGEKLLRMVPRGNGNAPSVPFLVLTAVTDAARRARLIEQGAADVITKPFHTADLVARVALHLKLVRIQRELLEKNAALERLSRTDALTGLANRREMDEALEREFRRSHRYEVPFSVVMADLDHFKTVNDRHGHDAGDRVLRAVAGVMASDLRDTDLAGRYGGEEFLAILGNNGIEGAAVFAERLRGAVEALEIELDSGESIGVTLSLGLAQWHPERTTVSEIVGRADAALYLAKETGRNRFCLEADTHSD